MNLIKEYQKVLESAIAHRLKSERLPELYEPLRYTFEKGGKRIRPLLVLLSAAMAGGDPKQALPMAVAVEFFHNFTLLHDDIMDNAPMRRGRESVYKKFSTNHAILSGDVLMIMAYQELEKCNLDRQAVLLQRFNRTAREVCEGQAMDLDFEKSGHVSLADYLEMIRLKTSVLLGFSMFAGAYMANGDVEKSENYYKIGEKMGLAFQIQDDYLDSFGDPVVFGKQIGGDILMNKKTFLLLKALEEANEKDRMALSDWMNRENPDEKAKIKAVKEVLERSGAKSAALKARDRYYSEAMSMLEEVDADQMAKKEFRSLAGRLLVREQ